MVLSDRVILELCDPLRHTAEQAARARKLLKCDPLLDVRLARALRQEEGEPRILSPRQCARLLHVLDMASEGSRLVHIVLQLIHDPDPRLRSKAVLFISRRVAKPEWVSRFRTERDARVRANAIEGVWGIDLPGTRTLLREAIKDEAPRVAGNALYGLCLLGDPAAVTALQEMAVAEDPARVATAAWVMGQTEDAAWEPVLRRLAQDPAGNVRRSAIRALVRLRRGCTPLKTVAESDPDAPISKG